MAKARQVESTIQDLQTYEATLTGCPAQTARTFFPLLNMAEGFRSIP